MAAVKNGTRERFLEYSGPIHVSSLATWVVQGTGLDAVVVRSSNAKGSGIIKGLGVQLIYAAVEGGTMPPVPYMGTPGPANYGGTFELAIIDVPSFDGGDTMYQAGANAPGHFTRPGSYSASEEGTISIKLAVEDWREGYFLDPTKAVYIPDPMQPFPISAGFPPFGGNAQPDSVPANGVRAWDVAKIGGYLEATVTLFGVTKTVRCKITPENVFAVTKAWNPFAIDYGLRATTHVTVTNSSGESTFEPKFGSDLSLTAPYDESDPSSGTRGWATSGVGASASHSGTVYSAMAVELFPPRRYRLRVSLRSFDQPYAGTGLSATWTVSGSVSVPCAPVVDAFGDQKRYKAKADLNTVMGPELVLDEWTEVRAWLSGMSAVGTEDDPEINDKEDRRDHRLLIHGGRWDAASFSVEAETEIVSAGGDWTGGTAGGLGRILTASGTRDLDVDERVWESSRYFRPQLKLTASEPKVVTITVANDRISKEYRVRVAPGDTVSPLIDGRILPWNLPPEVEKDTRDSRSPLRFQPSTLESPIATGPEEKADYLEEIAEGDDPDDLEEARGWVWGVNRPTSVTFSCDLGGGETLEVGKIDLVRQDPPKLSLIDAFKGDINQFGGWRLLWKSTAFGGDTTVTGQVVGGPFATLNVDGRIAFDLPAYWYDQPVVGASSFVYPSVSDIVGWFNAFPGVTATEIGSGGNPAWLTNANFAPCLGGSGAIWTGSAWEYWADKEAASVTIKAQELLDELDVPPEWGDGLNQGAYGRTDVAACKFLRARAEGVVADPATRKPAESVLVETEDVVAAVSAGTATTDARGTYVTGTPWGRGSREHETRCDGTVSTRKWRNGWPERTAFFFTQPSEGGLYAVSSRGDGRLFRLMGDSEGEARIDVAWSGTSGAWTERSTGLPIEGGDVRAIKGTSDVAVAIIDGGTLTVRMTRDEGRTLEDPVSLGSADAVTMADAGDGRLYVAKLDGGTVKVSLLSTNDLTVLGGPWTTNLTGLSSDARIDGDGIRLEDNRFALLLVTAEGGTPTLHSSFDGRTFD